MSTSSLLDWLTSLIEKKKEIPIRQATLPTMFRGEVIEVDEPVCLGGYKINEGELILCIRSFYKIPIDRHLSEYVLILNRDDSEDFDFEARNGRLRLNKKVQSEAKLSEIEGSETT